MDLRRRQWSISPIFLAATVVTLLFELQLSSAAATENVVFEVRSKFGGKIEKDLRALKAHDAHRHSRLLSSAIDLPLGGDSWPTGQYFAKIGLGTPSRDFHVQVDTGSDLLWVNCAGCIKCPRKSDLVKLTPYDSDVSSTAQTVSCDDSFCSYVYQTSKCHSASQRKVKKCFAHCLDNKNGGGIFAIGEVVSPKVKTTPMLSKSDYYSVSLTSVEVGNSVLQLSSGEEVIVDSGTTLAYLPNSVYMPLMNEIFSTHPELTFHNVQDLQGSFICFRYTDDKLDLFPPVTFQFDKSASLTVYPQDYLLQLQRDAWCFGWQISGLQMKDGRELLILGDMALSNKLVVYDIENQVMGWTNHNCSGGIQVKDEQSGSIYTVGAHNLSWSSSLTITKLLTIVSLLVHFLFTM
ncbi:BnaAnng12680D [Brassica napus]|uniref:BnaAnng12680D protein n=1 Tax=Brassica napus TaxID=3708 RepID=A0A078IRP9_BRANA|nr:BnaAnng12680D [Brassica napus]